VVLREHLDLLTPDHRTIFNGAHAPSDTGHWLDWVDLFLPGCDGAGDEVLAIGRDATARHVAEVQLVESEARFRELADRSADVVWRFRYDPEPHFEYISPAVQHILGFTPEWLLGDFNRMLDLLEPDSRALVMESFVGGFPIPRTDLRFRRADGRIIIGETVTTPTRHGLQGISRDVTELRDLQESLASLALRDPLTGLANRRLLDELLAQALARVKVSGRTVSVVFLDLDHFKVVNDTYGHDAGDIVLRETARRLLSVVRSGEAVVRLGGDEFVIICEMDQTGAGALAARIEAALALPIAVSLTVSVCCPASIGIADTASVGMNLADLLAAADAAMYRVKESHRQQLDTCSRAATREHPLDVPR
jgi:diguanylate cyclase (GGDEF)-like protein/PAS domain S-box-containing protein